MTAQQILDYLNAEGVAKSRDSTLTRFYFSNGQLDVMHFYKKDQKQELVEQNRWLAATENNPLSLIEFDGNDIIAMKSGTSADY